MTASAVISDCGTYRYVLRRTWRGGPVLAFVMLNPSTADAEQDDATIRKCIGFAKRYGFGGIVVVNLFALRSRDPAALRTHPSPIGPENDYWLKHETVNPNHSIIVAWGRHAEHFPGRVRAVMKIIERAVRCLDVTKDGHPSHPLMLPYKSVPQPWIGDR